jgi:hypothetical protein
MHLKDRLLNPDSKGVLAVKRIFKLITIFILFPTASVGLVGGEEPMKITDLNYSVRYYYGKEKEGNNEVLFVEHLFKNVGKSEVVFSFYNPGIFVSDIEPIKTLQISKIMLRIPRMAPPKAEELIRLAPGKEYKAVRWFWSDGMFPYHSKPEKGEVFQYEVPDGAEIDLQLCIDLTGFPNGLEKFMKPGEQLLKGIVCASRTSFSYRKIEAGMAENLPELKNLLNSDSLDVKESAINALIATRLPEAVTILVNYCEQEKNDQLVWVALNGFLLFHPESAKDDLVRLAQSRRIAESEFPEMAQGQIIRVIGLMGNPAFITDIQALDKKLPSGSASNECFQDTREFSVLMACSRLGDSRSADKLIKKLHEIPLDDLLNCLQEVPYVQSRVVARGLLSFLDDQRQGSALSSFNRRIGASAPKDSKATKKSDGTPFGTVKDDAVVAILRMLPDEPWGVEVDPHRRYSDQEVQKIKDHLQAMKL